MNTIPAVHQLQEDREAISRNDLLVVAYKQQISTKSLLRYPGGKTRGVDAIVQFFPPDLKEVCSPFFGGGSLELYLASKGIKVHGYDVFKPLVEFWECVIKSPKQLADIVQTYYPLQRDTFYDLQKTQTRFRTKIERAAVYYVLNRSSFSGATLSGGMSPQHPRFTLSSIQRVRDFYNPNFEVKKSDFKRSIKEHANTFLYLDPPYLIESALYGKKGDTHKDFDHNSLCEILKERSNWILSYNDCDKIREMYAAFKMLSPSWKYGMSNNKSSREILIFSHDINPFNNAITNTSRQSI